MYFALVSAGASLHPLAGQHQLGSGEKAALRPFGVTGGPTLGLAEALIARLRPTVGLPGRCLGRTKFCRVDILVLPALGTARS